MITASSAFLTANAAHAKKPIFIFEIVGYDRIFVNLPTGVSGQRPWIEEGGIADLSITVSDIDGSADLGQLSVTVQDYGHLITADMPNGLFEGKAATLKTGYIGMSQTDYALLWTGIIDTVDSANDNLSYVFNCFDVSQVLSKLIFVTGDSGAPTDSTHTKKLNGHPLDILLEILRTEVGLADTFIDVTKIQAFRDGLYGGMQYKFDISSPPTAKDFIDQQIMQPLGGYCWVNNKGQISVNFFDPGSVISAMSLTPSNTVGIPLAATAPLINVISFRFDKDDQGNYLSESIQKYGASIARFGSVGAGQLNGEQIIQSDGMRAGFQGFFLASYISRFIFFRYGLKNLQYEGVRFLWTACLLEPGDIALVTNPFVPDRQAGVVGITNRFMEVMDRDWNFQEGIVTLKLLDASYLAAFINPATGSAYLIAPNTTPVWTSASSTEKGKYVFLCNDSDQFSDTTPAHPLG